MRVSSIRKDGDFKIFVDLVLKRWYDTTERAFGPCVTEVSRWVYLRPVVVIFIFVLLVELIHCERSEKVFDVSCVVGDIEFLREREAQSAKILPHEERQQITLFSISRALSNSFLRRSALTVSKDLSVGFFEGMLYLRTKCGVGCKKSTDLHPLV